jgi:hypothetical protein
VRAFLPLTAAELASFAAAGSFGGTHLVLHTDTPALRAARPEADEEEREFAATAAAADAALRRLAEAGGPDPWRRIVLAVDVDPSAAAAPDEGPTAVVVPGPLAWSAAASILADDAAAGPDVRRAAESGDPSLADGHDLLWFGLQERAELLP